MSFEAFEHMKNIIIERGKHSKLEDLPPYSIAIDGRVQGPQIDTENHRYSFDHHFGCLRFCTLAACQQAATAVLLGLDPTEYTAYLDDADVDVCTAVWCLENPDRVNEPLAKKLIDAVGTLDMHAGAYSVNGMMKVVEWISAPELEAKKSNDYQKVSNETLRSVLEAVLHRIDQYVNGESSEDVNEYCKKIKNEHDHENFSILRNENGYAVIEAVDPHIYTRLWKAGFERLLVVRPRKDTLDCTIIKKSDFVDSYPLLKFYEALNIKENLANSEFKWGGGTSCGGPPRFPDGSRSKLNLIDVYQEIDKAILKG